MASQLHPEPQGDDVGALTNKLRAGVLGANDGIVSTAGLVLGVAGAAADSTAILTAGLAGLVAGALSMAVGEYVSVSTQRDTEQALLAKERWELEHLPEQELEELVLIYEGKGLSRPTAEVVAKELTAHDAFTAHATAELGIDPEGLVSPWAAAISSLVSFTVGALLPLLTMALAPNGLRVWVTFGAMIVALVLTGWFSAHVGGAHRGRAVTRVVVGGTLAMVVTYLIGLAVGTAIG